MDLSRDGLTEFARQFVAELPRERGARSYAVGLTGELGSGKTTFVQEVARSLGVTEHVTSPTFVFAKNYETDHPIFTKLIHIDAYRLEDETKDTVGFEAYLADRHALVLIEWPENVSYMKHSPFTIIAFETINETTRRVSAEQKR